MASKLKASISLDAFVEEAKKNGFASHEQRYERDIYYQLSCRCRGIGPVLLDMFGELPIDSRNKRLSGGC